MNIFQKSLLAAGLLGLGSTIAAPAFAGPCPTCSLQSYASGSSSIVLMNGASQSIGAEIGLQTGQIFDLATGVVVTPAKTGTLEVNTSTFDASPALLDAGAIIASTADPNASVEAAVATLINGSALDVGVSLTRAWRSGLQ